jgi:hypothetical protein
MGACTHNLILPSKIRILTACTGSAIDSVFSYNFELLDAYIKNGKTAEATGSQTRLSILYMENMTGIKSNGPMTYVGKTTFSKENLEAWHAWYITNRNKLRWNLRKKEVTLSQ